MSPSSAVCVCVCVRERETDRQTDCVWLQMDNTAVDKTVTTNTLSIGCLVAVCHQCVCVCQSWAVL